MGDQAVALHLAETETAVARSSFGRLAGEDGARTAVRRTKRVSGRRYWLNRMAGERTEHGRASCPEPATEAKVSSARGEPRGRRHAPCA